GAFRKVRGNLATTDGHREHEGFRNCSFVPFVSSVVSPPSRFAETTALVCRADVFQACRPNLYRRARIPFSNSADREFHEQHSAKPAKSESLRSATLQLTQTAYDRALQYVPDPWPFSTARLFRCKRYKR